MHIDVLTLMIAGSFVAGIGCILLFGAWAQLRPAPAIPWWAVAYLLYATAIAVLASGFAQENTVLVAVASGGVPLAAAGIWAGARSFQRRSVPWWVLAAVPIVWLVGGFLPLPGGPRAASVETTFVLTAALLVAACIELWRGRSEKLAARWALIGIIAFHAAIYAGGVVDVSLGNVPPDAVPPLTSWFGLIHFEQMVFLLGGGVCIIMMCRERQEGRYIAAARIDSLTGVANRGAFFHQAERILQRARQDGAPVSLIAFDLDHFKSINDTHGHAVGDRVLRAFAEIAEAVLRPGDLFGRIGGEEFAAMLQGSEADAAYVIADRVRHAFESVPRIYGGAAVRATVSAGVACATPGGTLEAVLEAADRALYRAKSLGRNRVERAAQAPFAGSGATAVRVA